MQDNHREKCIYMSEEEAMGLLEMATRFQGELSPDQIQAIIKLTELCRSHYRETSLSKVSTIHSNCSNAIAA